MLAKATIAFCFGRMLKGALLSPGAWRLCLLMSFHHPEAGPLVALVTAHLRDRPCCPSCPHALDLHIPGQQPQELLWFGLALELCLSALCPPGKHPRVAGSQRTGSGSPLHFTHLHSQHIQLRASLGVPALPRVSLALASVLVSPLPPHAARQSLCLMLCIPEPCEGSRP